MIMAKQAVAGVDASYSAMIKRKKIFRTIICILLCIVSVFPFYTMIVNSTLPSSTIQRGLNVIPGTNFGSNFSKLMELSNGASTTLWAAMLHSAMISVPATILQVYFSTMTAYGFTVYRFKLRNFGWSFIMGIMMVPAQVSIIGFMRFMLKVHLYNTYWPLILPAIAAPSTVYFMKQYMTSALSIDIIEAARIDGSGEFSTFNRIALPLMKPAMATQAIFAFVASWNNLYTPSMILISDKKWTLPMFVQGLRSDNLRRDYGVIYIGLTLTILPILLVYLILSKYIIAGVALGGVKE